MSNRMAAFFAYLVPILGPLYALLAHRDKEFPVFHAKQSLILTMTAIGAPLVWGVFAWVIFWLPTAGPLIGTVAFTLVILIYMLLAVDWILGLIRALRYELKPLPVVGRWAERIPFE
jgi:uncharacterized membrane protein